MSLPELSLFEVVNSFSPTWTEINWKNKIKQYVFQMYHKKEKEQIFQRKETLTKHKSVAVKK